jgi:hypothetical protein
MAQTPRIINRRHWHGFVLEDSRALALAPALEALAGPRMSKFEPGLLQAPPNCAWLVNQALTQSGVRFTYVPPLVTPRPAPALLHVPERREWTKLKFRPFQLEGILSKLHMPGSNFWWEPGAGKTRGALEWGFSYPGSVLFITRAGARNTIHDEAVNCYEVEPLVLEGRGAADELASKVKAKEPLPRLVITAWETLSDHIDGLLQLKFASLVMDEIHRAKSRDRWSAREEFGTEEAPGAVTFELKSNRAGASVRIAENIPRRLGTTATPIYNRLEDLYAQLTLVQPGEWGGWHAWATRYCAAVKTPYGLDTRGRSNVDELTMRLMGEKPVPDRSTGSGAVWPAHKVPRTVSHAQLPQKLRQICYVPVDAQNKGEAVKQELKRARVANDLKAILEVRLYEACCRKRGWLVDWLAEQFGLERDGADGTVTPCTPLKVVVVSARLKDAQKLKEVFESRRPSVKTWLSTGEDSDAHRQLVQREYMGFKLDDPKHPEHIPRHPGPCVVFGTRQSLGESINLQDTDIAVCAIMPDNSGQVEQFEGRFTRQGQSRPVRIMYPVASGTVDERMASILLDKLPDAEEVAGTTEVAGFAAALGRGGKTKEELTESLLGKILAGEESWG